MTVTGADRFVLAYASDDQQTEIWNLNGVAWHDAPKPSRWHRCRPQTRGFINYFTKVIRCACGAISSDGRYWLERNSR